MELHSMIPNRNRRFSSVKPFSIAEVQSLETRQLLTGTVNVSISTAGDVTLNGDRFDNDVAVNVNATHITLTGHYGTLIKVGKSAAVANVVLPLPSLVRDVNVNLHGGNDKLSLNTSANTSIRRDVIINTGIGDDKVNVFPDGSTLTVGRNVQVATGTGKDLVDVTTSNGGAFVVKGDLSIDTGLGDDAVVLEDADRFGALASVDDLLAVPNNTGVANSQSIRIWRDLNISTDGGKDRTAIMGVEAGRDVNIRSGIHRGDVLGVSNLRVGRNLLLHWGDDNALQNVTVVGRLKVQSGGGGDRFAVQNLTARTVDIAFGTKDDQLAVGPGVTVTHGGSINGGTGKNRLLAAAPIAGVTVKKMAPTLTQAEADDIVDDVFSSLIGLL
jgi:hypothetical protein